MSFRPWPLPMRERNTRIREVLGEPEGYPIEKTVGALTIIAIRQEWPKNLRDKDEFTPEVQMVQEAGTKGAKLMLAALVKSGQLTLPIDTDATREALHSLMYTPDSVDSMSGRNA